jgi:lipoprotein-anchoring transpeptidase ErfK/SrfK
MVSVRFWMSVGAVAVGAGLMGCFSAPALALGVTEIPHATPSAASLAASPAPAEAETETHLVLSLGARTVSLYQGEVLISSYPVAVGAAETPTPQGQFTVSQMVIEPRWQSPWTGELHEPGPDTALGLRWIGFSSNEEGSFGFHGTPTVESIGQAASNGCVRMYNEDVVELFEQVVPGMTVYVVP